MTVSSEISKDVYSGTGTQTEFTVSFYFLANEDVEVIHRDTGGVENVWVEGTHYHLMGAGIDSGGQLTVLTDPDDYTPATGEKLIIKRNLKIVQETDYPEGGAFPASAHENAIDRAVMRDQQLNEAIGRCLRFSPTSSGIDPTLPGELTALDVIRVNAAGDGLEAISSTDISTVAGIAAAIQTVSNISEDISAVLLESANISTVAGINGDVMAVAAIESAVSTVATISADVSAASAITSDITTVGQVASQVPDVAAVAADIPTVAAISTDLTAVAAVAADIQAVAGISSDIPAVASIASDVPGVASVAGDIPAVAGVSSDIPAVSGVAGDVSTVATISSDVSTVAEFADDISSAVAAAGTGSFRWSFDDNTTMADPGTGEFRFNNGTLSNATEIAITAEAADTGNPDVSALVATWGDSTSSIKGYLYVRKVGAPATFAVFAVTDTVTDNGAWLRIPVSHVVSQGTISNADNCALSFIPVGDKGDNEVLVFAVTNEDDVIAAAVGQFTFRMPFAMTASEIRASLATASSSGGVTIDVNESGSTILSTKLTIDVGEKTSTTAATPAVISDANLADDAEITVDIDTAGTGAVGLKVSLIGTRT